MEEEILMEMETYFSRFQNTAAQFIATRTIINLCLAADQRPGSRVVKRCWDQYGLDLKGMQTAAQEAKWTNRGEEMDRTETEIY